MMHRSRPTFLRSTLVVAFLTGLWGYLRLFLFPEAVLPITFVLPLLVCVWTGRRWQLWSMAVIFCVMAIFKVYFVVPDQVNPPYRDALLLASTLFNIVVGAIVVQVVLNLREGLEQRNATITAQNAELEAQAEELSQQNEEIKAQSEELAEQNEEIEAQSEELAQQNEDLTDLNARLSGREEILQGLLQASRELESISSVLEGLCRRALVLIGKPAVAVAVLEQQGDSLVVHSQVTSDGHPAVPGSWPLTGSVAEVVFKEMRSAYVSDLRQRTDLARPFGPETPYQSVLATPVKLAGPHAGLLLACSVSATHWTEEQFRILEWLAAQCGFALETLHSQKSLAEHARALEAANNSKDRFLAMLSHELRTPLTPVLAASGILENDERLPDDVRESFRMIRRNVGIQSRLIDDLLDLTRVSRGKVELDRQVLPIGSLLRDTTHIVASDLGAKSQSLKLDLDGLNEHAVAGDGARLQQVFWNLLKNAIKFSGNGTPVTVRGYAEDHHVTVEVSDSGCGISEADIERIFLPFEQATDKNRPASEAGLGLGLTIAKAIVELHGGSISVRSPGPGRGATFCVRLPAMAGHAPVTDSGSGNGAGKGAPAVMPLRILFVEDHVDSGKIMSLLLRSAGHDVDHVETATAAFRLFQEKEYDLLISDLGLPDESGLALMRRMCQVRPGFTGICLSGYGMEKDVSDCHAAGFKEHLTKPVEIARLKAAIARVTKDISPVAPAGD